MSPALNDAACSFLHNFSRLQSGSQLCKSTCRTPSSWLGCLTYTNTQASGRKLLESATSSQQWPPIAHSRLLSSTRSRSRHNSHKPSTPSGTDETYHVLTLQTDAALHEAITSLRNRYFPSELNKLSAHLTLFHALPGSRLESHIAPVLQNITQEINAYPIATEEPFRLKRGIGITVSDVGKHTATIYRHLQNKWHDFLSKQDGRPLKLHYTIMNKVADDRHVETALREICESFCKQSGHAVGLALWTYDRGWWKDPSFFEFRSKNTNHR